MKIGCVKYLNARPLIHGWPGPVEFDHPSALCAKLARGELDVALVSSIEYLRRPHYRVVDAVSISAFGPVYSVIVAHQEEPSSLADIALDPASETSVALLRVLWNTGLEPVRPAGLYPADGVLREESPTNSASGSQSSPPPAAGCKPAGRSRHSPVFLIGDQAVRFRQAHPECRYWDLAEQWKKLTGLPFVFALWLVRPEVENAYEIADQLRALRDRNMGRLDEIIASVNDFDRDFARRYFSEYLDFHFGAPEKAGLREFQQRCVANCIDVAPQCDLDLV